MKYLIVSDIHGSSLEPLRKILETKKIDRLICLGNFDTVDAIEEYMELERRFKGVTVPGNHDFAHFNKIAINSPEMQKKNYSSIQLQVELDSNMAAKEWMRNLLKDLKKTFKFERCKHDALLIHGGLGGKAHGTPGELFDRMLTTVEVEKNLEAMKKGKIWLMIRGNDASPQYIYTNPFRKLVIQNPKPGEKLLLSQQMMQIVNPGSYAQGCYAIIDTDYPGEAEPMISFHKFVRGE